MVLNSGLRGLAAGPKKTANSGLNEAIAAKLHMSSNSGTMPQIAIAEAIAGDLKLCSDRRRRQARDKTNPSEPAGDGGSWRRGRRIATGTAVPRRRVGSQAAPRVRPRALADPRRRRQ